jgi:hypothetical protein
VVNHDVDSFNPRAPEILVNKGLVRAPAILSPQIGESIHEQNDCSTFAYCREFGSNSFRTAPNGCALPVYAEKRAEVYHRFRGAPPF